ncbi:XTP/dITP diphosphohydrolase [Ectothiorhodosinus mongolicus]|uniref:dITP/XTP pyrophosphatase n=1 Tax=Ectothiorhodosinus mongolicus TaxID=233100 RepID=A0A1R3VZ29_9GAMM|nr:RdgB/HAM1 family non-canonical purine NTP pyrophosphatase [Ectothiorhodosinus mongolicus]ULX57215.1 non-canonical purine NTP pyrophosphatase, RdgB/HAM1 family [Ectothiorhodosinus mongolicus]SIT70459.1 XTP/dITP diphosphohydrolase [Ectothiorhodosinus mongolicus]
MKIVLATGNAGKLREFSQMLQSSGFEIVPQSAFEVTEVAETGLSFVENALIKARHAAQHTGLPALADDSGIEVDFLQGAPGIYSARYAGARATTEENNHKLLRALSGVSAAQRTARFRSVIVFLRHATDPSPVIAEGHWEGQIAIEPAGDQGHGYDPIFLIPEQGKTAAQLPAEEKNRLSHRGQALRNLLHKLPPLK